MNKKNRVSLSVVFPVFNEEESAVAALQKTESALKKYFPNLEIIVVDDGSTDNTGQILDKLKLKGSSLRIFHNPINLGQGLSLLTGFKKSKGELVTHNGVDLPLDPGKMAEFAKFFPKYDIVVVERADRAAYSTWRKFTSVTNNILRWLFLSKKFKDLNFVQIYKARVLENIHVESKGATMVTTELVLKAEKSGFKIKRVKAPYLKREFGQGFHGKSHDILIAIAEMINFWLKVRLS